MQDGRMSICKRDALIALEQLWSLVGIVFRSADPSRFIEYLPPAELVFASNYNSLDFRITVDGGNGGGHIRHLLLRLA